MAKRPARKATKKESPFGESSRVELIEEHLQKFGKLTAENAWMFVYEELLWFDKSTGLIHLYESDKVRPGRSSWYQRSITFTDRLSKRFGVDRAGLKTRIDRLFLACLERLVAQGETAKDQQAMQAIADTGEEVGLSKKVVAKSQAASDEQAKDEDFVPYLDLVAEISELLISRAGIESNAAMTLAKEITKRAEFHLTFGSNRQNVLGEGFEDVLRLLAMKVSKVPPEKIAVRKKASELPGFQAKPKEVRRIETPDIAIVEGDRTKLLSTVKWSLRHDRQKQLSDELDCYVQLKSQPKFPEYVLITNEYDPGRLKNSSNLSSRGRNRSRVEGGERPVRVVANNIRDLGFAVK